MRGTMRMGGEAKCPPSHRPTTNFRETKIPDTTTKPEESNGRTINPMPSRLKRYQQQGDYHAINFSCYHRLPHLSDDHSRLVVEETLEQLRQRHQFSLFGYVIMPNHVHLLLAEPKLQPLATTLSVLKKETSKRPQGHAATVLATRYYDFNILTHEKLTEKLKYIHRNPVEGGLVEKPEDWEWSSYRHYLTGEPGRVEIEPQYTWTRREA